MDTSDLSALAGNTLVAAAVNDANDAWATARAGFAAVFGRGQPDPDTLRRLDATHSALHTARAADLKQVQAAEADHWATRTADLLEDHPPAEAYLYPLMAEIRTRLPAEQAPAGQAPAEQAQKPLRTLLLQTTPYLASSSLALFSMGFLFIAFYVVSNRGQWLGELAVGWLTACAAFAAGGLAGLVVGIPRFVSSGALRHDVETGRVPAMTTSQATRGARATGDQAGQDQVSGFTSSSNLAEISDWLTKLLLGAGLVGLTHLSKPLGALVNDVAAGLGSATSSGRVVAAAILMTYVTLGFIDLYVVTTLWYGKHLQQLGY
jgi:hypothetical protein